MNCDSGHDVQKVRAEEHLKSWGLILPTDLHQMKMCFAVPMMENLRMSEYQSQADAE